MKKYFFIAALLSLLLSPEGSFSQEKIKIKRISIFKDGSAFFEKEASVNASGGSATLEKLPYERENNLQRILFGTIWFAAKQNEITSVNSYPTKIKEEKKAEALKDLLKANIGKSVDVKLYNIAEMMKAKIVSVEGELVTFEGKDFWKAVHANYIENVSFEKEPSAKYTEEKDGRIIKLEFKKNNSSQDVGIMYMQKGITWLPNYLIELLDGKKARVKLRANVMNDIEDIENAEINFVVGVPSFLYSRMESPLTSGQTVQEMLNSLSGGYPGYYDAPAPVMTQRLMNRMDENVISDYESASYEPVGSSNEDLFLYNKENISLKKGGRAFFDILATEVEYEDIYSVSLNPVTIYSYSTDYNKENKNDVWHSIRFENKTSVPWTTGTAFVTKADKSGASPISQNDLNYTPVKAKTEVKLTISPDILVSDSEKETDRVEQAKKFDYWNDLITMEGTIKLKNFKNEAIKLKITRIIEGELAKSNESWDSKSLLKTSNVKNKKNDVTWEVELKPGESKEIVYTYKIYVQK